MYSVLLVEDDAQIREVIGDYFGRRDKIALEFAEDGNIGLSKILNNSYDLIVLDIMMPGLDGFELCKIIRKKSNVPVVFLTGKVREEDVLYGYELGADDYIVKPFSIAVLYSKLLAMLERTAPDHESRKVLESGQITVDPVKFEAKGNIGYIRVLTFSEKTTSELHRAIKELKSKIGSELIGFVLDIRNNPGGLLDQAVGVADTFFGSRRDCLYAFQKARGNAALFC